MQTFLETQDNYIDFWKYKVNIVPLHSHSSEKCVPVKSARMLSTCMTPLHSIFLAFLANAF